MSTIMRGWVEVKDLGDWLGSIEVYKLFCGAGNYGMFGSLFGKRNYAEFTPIAEKRGVPPDASKSFKEDLSYWEGHSATWITYKEIKAIKWNETGLKPCLSSKYKIKDGQFLREDASDNELTEEEQKSFYSGKSIEKNGYVYLPEILTRRSVLSWEWSLLFNIMCLLSEKYGDEEIRLVVFFEG
jgi:hypothetical protein